MRNLFFLFLALTFSGSSVVSFAADKNCPCGDWLGYLSVGSASMRMVFHISNEHDSLRMIMDSPDQRIKGIPAKKAVFADQKLVASVGTGTFEGALVNDSTLEGTWKQGQVFPMVMHRVTSLEKPQTPVAPFPYTSEDLTFDDTTTHLTYGATITYPADNKKHPAVLLLTGSGQQDRNEEILGQKPFFVLADYLTRQGYVVMRVDDRGIGQTTGLSTLKTATTEDFAKDANAEFEFLKKRKEVDPGKIGLLGHSEGGMIAIMLGAKRKDVSFIISLAGPGTPIRQLQIEQNDALLKQQGVSEEGRKSYLKLYSAIVDTALQYKSAADMTAAIEKLVTSWRSVTADSIVVATTNITDEASLRRFSTGFASQLAYPWSRYFFSYNPQPDIVSLKCKVLALNGGKDVQVISKSNLQGWKSSLAKSKSKAYEVKELPGLNHLFQECRTCGVDEYGILDQTISPVALETIGGWMKKEVK